MLPALGLRVVFVWLVLNLHHLMIQHRWSIKNIVFESADVIHMWSQLEISVSVLSVIIVMIQVKWPIVDCIN